MIVTAHNRRQFLRDAVESVLAQDVDQSKYEIVVVKNFPDTDLDHFLDRHGARRILSYDQSPSLKVAEGIRACRGDIVLLLDDDDLFERSKLRVVLREFEAHPRLGFYHNQVSYIGQNGDPLAPGHSKVFGFRPAGRSRRVLLTNAAKDTGLAQVAFSYPDFNSSSLAIRRDLAVDSFPFLTRIEGGPDTFFFFVALLSTYSLLLDNALLTRYRIHDENASLAGGADRDERRARLLAAAQKQDLVNRVIREMVVGSGDALVLREIDARILLTRLSILFRDLRSGRLEAARAVLRAISLQRTLAMRENIPSVVGAMLFALTPRLARTTYEHRVSIR